VLSGCFARIFSRHSSHRVGYFLMYTLTLPLSGVLGLFALLLNEPNGNIFFVEYFTRLFLNVMLFSISCRGKGVERPQQDIFNVLLWTNVICFICIMGALSNRILDNSGTHQNVLSVHETHPSTGTLYLEGMAPRVSLNNPVFDRESVTETLASDSARTEDDTEGSEILFEIIKSEDSEDDEQSESAINPSSKLGVIPNRGHPKQSNCIEFGNL